MPTNATRTQTTPANAAPNAALEQQQKLPQRAVSDGSDSARKPAGFGLPCSKCCTYYPADLDRCPICNHNERVSPVVPKIPPKSVQAASAPAPTSAALEKEREEFLKQFKAQAGASVPEVPGAINAACAAAGHHPGESGSAEVCKTCYERMQERLDICEASLHMDLKEAAQIIYDAVWADPSDPNKTYQNAANALLAELRKRTGMNSLKGAFQPLAD